MIPYILIIIGIPLAIFGLWGLISLAVLPYRKLKKAVFEFEDDILKFSSETGRRQYNQWMKQIIWIYILSLFLGAISFFLGIYLGYAAKGSSFWFYEQIFGEEIHDDYWDCITEDNKFVSSSGNTYTYYILITEDK